MNAPYPTFLGITKGSGNKGCTDSLVAYGQFSDNDLHRAFDEDIKSHDSTALRMMAEFVQEFLDPTLWLQLVRCILDMIETDRDIQADDEFFINADAPAVKAKDICKTDHFYVESFLLGVWHYIIMNRADDNEKDADTYKVWYPSKGNYRGTVGNGISRKISIESIPIVSPHNTETAATDDEPQVEVIGSNNESGKSQAKSKTFTQYIENATIVNQNSEKNITIQTAAVAPQLLTQKPQPTAMTVSRTHYNLFVTYGADFSQNTPFTVEAARALTEYMDDDLKAEYATLSPDVIEKVKSFPCIFANENADYGHTDEEQTLGYGFIRQIKIRKDGIKIYPQIVYLLPQQRLNEAFFDLDIRGSSSFNEFNRMHWSIKKIDLIAVLG